MGDNLHEESLASVSKQSVSSPIRTGSKNSLIHFRESLLNRMAGVRPSLAINAGVPESTMSPPDDLAARLKQNLDELKLAVMDETGSKVDYAALRDSPAYTSYREEHLAVLRHYKPDNLPSLQARRAFWINLYNALVMDAVITFGIQRSVTEGRLGLLFFFRRAAYIIDGRRVSLEDIEHGILRANRGNPYIPGAHFPSDDPRLAWSLPLDPRLHFALNCGGRSCPPIRSYSAAKLDEQLDLAARSFVASTVEIQAEKSQVALSPIFQWYKNDFGGQDGALDFIIRNLPTDERCQLLLKSRNKLRIHYSAYDWGLNSA